MFRANLSSACNDRISLSHQSNVFKDGFCSKPPIQIVSSLKKFCLSTRSRRVFVCEFSDTLLTCGLHPARNGIQRKLNAWWPTLICLMISHCAGKTEDSVSLTALSCLLQTRGKYMMMCVRRFGADKLSSCSSEGIQQEVNKAEKSKRQ